MAGSENLVHLSDQTFDEEVLKSDVPVIVDFWAPWCAPCRAIGPIVEEIADTYAGKVKVGKMNVDEHTRVASQFQVTAIPTLLIFKDGQVAKQIIGAVAKSKIIEAIDGSL
ncbi:MAG: thioredoxin [Deltaproteobacteria bacterium]|nr:thioredoxin [Deltaproteobacteria bacterium]